MMNPVLVTRNLSLDDSAHHYYDKSGYSCTCVHAGCRPIPDDVNMLLLRAQVMRMTTLHSSSFSPFSRNTSYSSL
jgi:hypothetical protein